jgi:hypothetical protein
MTIWLRALRERFGGSGTRSGRKASLADFGMIGPFCPFGAPLFWFVSLTAIPSFCLCLLFGQAMRQKAGSEDEAEAVRAPHSTDRTWLFYAW